MCRGFPRIKTLSLQISSDANSLLAGRHLRGSEDQVQLAPDPDRLQGSSHLPHLFEFWVHDFKLERTVAHKNQA